MTTTATTTSLAYNEKAAYWEKWAETMARQSHRFNEPLLEAAGVGPGVQLLDLASGAGEPALSAAALVGPKGHVTASGLELTDCRYVYHDVIELLIVRPAA